MRPWDPGKQKKDNDTRLRRIPNGVHSSLYCSFFQRPRFGSNDRIECIQHTVNISDAFLLESDLPASLRKKFKNLLKEFYAIESGDPSDAAYGTVCEIFVRTVTDHPVLATVVSSDSSRPLLSALCGMFMSPLMLPAIKLLIQQNPSVLLWKSGRRQDGPSWIL